MECGAILDILRLQGLTPDLTTEAKPLLLRLVSMLSKMSL